MKEDQNKFATCTFLCFNKLSRRKVLSRVKKMFDEVKTNKIDLTNFQMNTFQLEVLGGDIKGGQ